MKNSYSHQQKADFVSRVDELMVTQGLSQNCACAVVGISSPQITKWRETLKNGGLDALKNKYQNCGRRPMYVPTAIETQGLREYVLNTDPTSGLRVNKILAAQLFARDARCSDELREILEKLGAERRDLPPSIAKAMHVRKSDKDIYRGPKRAALQGIFTPRGMTWVENGVEKPILPGEIFESDDMTLNGMFYVPWDSATDKCAAKYGVRVFRAQLLPWLDVATGGFVAYSLVLRESDAYKADDIRWSLSHLFKTVGVPKVLRLEHGSWASNSVESLEKDLSICRIVHAKTAKGKIIEGRFNQLQRVLAVNEIFLGRKRGEFEKANSDWLAYRDGRRDPRKELPSLAEQVKRIDAAFDFLNNKPINGEVYGKARAKEMYGLEYWIPAQIEEKFYMDNPRPRVPTIQEMAAILPISREVTIRHSMARVKCADWGGVYYFYSPEFAKLGDGWPIRISFDPSDPDRGAGIISLRETDDARNHCGIQRGEFIGVAQHVERVPQVVVGSGDTLGFERAKRHAKLAHLLFREIIPAHRKRGVTVHDYFNHGDLTRLEIDRYRDGENAQNEHTQPQRHTSAERPQTSRHFNRENSPMPTRATSDRRVNIEALFE